MRKQTWLFIFAHPDDETVAATATIKQLTDAGHKVVLVSVTAGQAGEVHERTKQAIERAGSLEAVRKEEFAAVCKLLGVTTHQILDYTDGQITNQDTWGSLQTAAIDLIDTHQPDYVVTFDHTGWYFHLDHVAVSIAVTRAFKHSEHRPLALLHAVIPMENSEKWVYDFPKLEPTHKVKVADLDFKEQALLIHQSQDLTTPLDWLSKPERQYEWYRLVEGSAAQQDILLPVER